MLSCSERQLWRLKAAYRREGVRGLIHRNRGRSPAHTLQETVRQAIVGLARSDAYVGYNHSHLQEVLAQEHGIDVSRRTLGRVLRTEGLRSPRRRRVRRYRSRRERAAQAGALVQVDASHHDWLEGRGPRLALIGAVDDATGAIVHAFFQDREDAAGYLRLLRDSVRAAGIPTAWYSDRHGSFQRNDKEPWTIAEQLAKRREPTQVGRALESLGIRHIVAYSPQAKGRVERCWGTLQDRLVKELRRGNATTIAEANGILATYIPLYNARFARAAADARSAYRPVPKRLDLDAICSFHYVRSVAKDNTVRIEDRCVQIPPGPRRRGYAGCRVQLQERLDGRMLVLYEARQIAEQAMPEGMRLKPRQRQRGYELPRDNRPSRRTSTVAPPTPTPGPWTPPAAHPWRRPLRERVTQSPPT
jgi:transposase